MTRFEWQQMKRHRTRSHGLLRKFANRSAHRVLISENYCEGKRRVGPQRAVFARDEAFPLHQILG